MRQSSCKVKSFRAHPAPQGLLLQPGPRLYANCIQHCFPATYRLHSGIAQGWWLTTAVFRWLDRPGVKPAGLSFRNRIPPPGERMIVIDGARSGSQIESSVEDDTGLAPGSCAAEIERVVIICAHPAEKRGSMSQEESAPDMMRHAPRRGSSTATAPGAGESNFSKMSPAAGP